MSYFLIGDSVTLTLLTVLLSIFVYHVYNLRTNNIIRRLGIPGPAPIPFVGEIFHVFWKGLNIYDTDLVKKYGRIIGVYVGTSPTILVSDPELLRNVFIKDFHVFPNRRVFEGLSGPFEYGLTGLKDEHWKNARAIVSPTFSSAKLKAMFPLMNTISDEYNKRLLEYADKQEMFDVKTINGQYTLDNITSCLFGVETNSLHNENVTLINHLKKFFVIDFKNIFLYIVLIAPRLAVYLGKRGYSILPTDAINFTVNLVNQILVRRRQHLERRNDFIQIMVDHEEEVKHEEETNKQEQVEEHKLDEEQEQQRKPLSKTLNDKEIVGQALVFLAAGYETTSVLMSFFFYVMATEPAVQEKVYEEIRQEIGNDEVTYEKLNQLQYLDMAINETLRMYPPFIRLDRVASEDYQLGDYHIPKGSIVGIPVYPIHHDPEFWPDPEKFIPERFSTSEKAKRHPMTFLPFGDGPRNCVGMRFALIEAKLAIVKALQIVEFQKCEKTVIPLKLGKSRLLNATSGVWLRVVRRSQ